MTVWWKHPNTWCVVVIVAGLTGMVALEIGLAVGSKTREGVAESQPELQIRHKPVPAPSDIQIISSSDADELLADARREAIKSAERTRLEQLDIIERAKALKDLYERRIRELDASERAGKDASDISTQRGGPT